MLKATKNAFLKYKLKIYIDIVNNSNKMSFKNVLSHYQDFLLDHSELAGLVGQGANDEFGFRQRSKSSKTLFAVENDKLKLK
jgi:hypothetical protein